MQPRALVEICDRMTAALETGQAERPCPCKVLCPWRFSVAHDVLYHFEVPCLAKGYYLFRRSLSLSSSLSRGGSLSRAPRRSCAHIGQKFFRPASPPSPCLPISTKTSFNKHHHAPVAVIHQRVSRSAPWSGSRWGAAAAITMPATQTSEIGR